MFFADTYSMLIEQFVEREGTRERKRKRVIGEMDERVGCENFFLFFSFFWGRNNVYYYTRILLIGVIGFLGGRCVE